MKKKLLFLLSVTVLAGATSAQVVRKGNVETATIKTPTVQCEECKQRVENYISREDGVLKVVADYKKKITKVTYLIDRENYESVKTAIANAGFDADDVTANPDSYQKLPNCCKKQPASALPPAKN